KLIMEKVRVTKSAITAFLLKSGPCAAGGVTGACGGSCAWTLASDVGAANALDAAASWGLASGAAASAASTAVRRQEPVNSRSNADCC
ncbi:MAG: hypothetical protein WC881_01930, partial [Elusimicrobiota bacterium]